MAAQLQWPAQCNSFKVHSSLEYLTTLVTAVNLESFITSAIAVCNTANKHNTDARYQKHVTSHFDGQSNYYLTTVLWNKNI